MYVKLDKLEKGNHNMPATEKPLNYDPVRPLAHEGPRLYQLVRTDIPQMNPGKLGAQTNHAGTQFAFESVDFDDELKSEVLDWRNQSRKNVMANASTLGGFGTVITLAATELEIKETLSNMARFGFHMGLVVDPTYPMMNVMNESFTREELTVGYVFVPRNAPKEALDELAKFRLHP